MENISDQISFVENLLKSLPWSSVQDPSLLSLREPWKATNSFMSARVKKHNGNMVFPEHLSLQKIAQLEILMHLAMCSKNIFSALLIGQPFSAFSLSWWLDNQDISLLRHPATNHSSDAQQCVRLLTTSQTPNNVSDY